MTSHAIAVNIRPVAALCEPVITIPAIPDQPVRTQDPNQAAGVGPQCEQPGEDYLMYIQMQTTPRCLNKCLTHLERHLQAHPDTDAEIVGIGAGQDTIRVIIGVNLGDSFKIKGKSKTVMAAYTFVQSLSANLANFWPQYLTGTPTNDERELLASVVAAGTIKTRPAMTTDAEMFFEPEQEFVLAGDGGIWQVETAVA